jgi:hypothetical protein
MPPEMSVCGEQSPGIKRDEPARDGCCDVAATAGAPRAVAVAPRRVRAGARGR